MMKLAIGLVSLLISNINEVSRQSVQEINGDSVSVSVERLHRIDLSKDSLLNIILHQVVEEGNGHSDLYDVRMNDYHEGTIVLISNRCNESFDESLYWNGYVVVDGIRFGIARIYSDYKMEYVLPEQTESFKFSSHDKASPNRPTSSWLYYILDDIFARYSPDEGWIWSDGKPDE